VAPQRQAVSADQADRQEGADQRGDERSGRHDGPAGRDDATTGSDTRQATILDDEVVDCRIETDRCAGRSRHRLGRPDRTRPAIVGSNHGRRHLGRQPRVVPASVVAGQHGGADHTEVALPLDQRGETGSSVRLRRREHPAVELEVDVGVVDGQARLGGKVAIEGEAVVDQLHLGPAGVFGPDVGRRVGGRQIGQRIAELDDDRAEPGPREGERRRDPNDAAADDYDIGGRWQRCGPLIPPQGGTGMGIVGGGAEICVERHGNPDRTWQDGCDRRGVVRRVFAQCSRRLNRERGRSDQHSRRAEPMVFCQIW